MFRFLEFRLTSDYAIGKKPIKAIFDQVKKLVIYGAMGWQSDLHDEVHFCGIIPIVFITIMN